MKDRARSSVGADKWVDLSRKSPMERILHDRRLPGFLAGLLGLWLYAGTYRHQYAYDDGSVITKNQIVTGGLSAEHLKLIWTTEYRHGNKDGGGSLYRPVPLTMFTAEWQFAPNDPRLGHAINILLYSLIGWMLGIIFSCILHNHAPAIGAAAVLLFIAHPVHTEVVANIKSRDELMALLFGLLALYSAWRYLERGGWARLLGVVMAFAVAIFSKESAITLVVLVPLAMWFFSSAGLRSITWVLAALLLPAIAFLLARYVVISAQPIPEVVSWADSIFFATDDRMVQFATAFRMALSYLRVLVFPDELVHTMGYEQVVPVGWDDWRAWAGFLLAIAAIVGAIHGSRERRLYAFALLFLLISFAPVSNVFFLIGTHYGERLLFMPSLGFALLLAWALAKVQELDDPVRIWDPNGKGRLFWGPVLIILALYSWRTVTRNRVWYDSATLTTHDIALSPNCVKLNVAFAARTYENSFDTRSGAFRDTVKIRPALAALDRATSGKYLAYAPAYSMRAKYWLALGDDDAAYADLVTSLKLDPEDVDARANLGILEAQRGDAEEAERIFRQVLERVPTFVQVYLELGLVLSSQGRHSEALSVWSQGMELDTAHAGMAYQIGATYAILGEDSLSAAWMNRAGSLEVHPPSFDR